MNNGLIKMTPEDMRSYAQHYNSDADQMSSLLSSLNQMESQVESSWAGKGFQQYEQRYHELAKQTNDFINNLHEIAGKLQQAANEMSSTDSSIASKFGA